MNNNAIQDPHHTTHSFFLGHAMNDTKMRDFLDKLSTCTNASKWIDLPMIAVFGETSTGKSSLLSNLGMIELPCNHSLTTRCPILLQLRHGGSTRQARITVQWKSTSNHDEMLPDFGERHATDDNWHEIPQFVQEAQEFILQHTGKEVALDIISLEITDTATSSTTSSADDGSVATSEQQRNNNNNNNNNNGDLPVLTMIDLPGLVQSRGQDEAESLIDDVQELLFSYLQNPRCVIVAVLPANVDFHNSQIMALAQQVDPHRRRTIPVITKPDLIDQGAEQDVLDLLLGRKIQFESHIISDNHHSSTAEKPATSSGFHIIKGRGQASLDRKQSIHEGLQDEQRFFDTVEPWKSVSDRSLFGTANLRRKLGHVMMQQVKDMVPPIVHEIRTKQQFADQQLSVMGRQALDTTVADRRRYYQDICTHFVNHLKASLSGKKGGRTTQQPLVWRNKNTRSGRDAIGKTATAAAAATRCNDNGAAANKKKPSAAAQLHEACTDFKESIQAGSLGTIRSIVEGAQVLVASTKGDVRGEVVHLEHDFACVDYIDETDDNVELLFEYKGYKAQQTLEVDEVWSDGNQIFIARKNNVFDSLRKIPLDMIRTDPSWLTSKISENRTDDLACFLNVDIFKNIVEDFVEDDWKPHCEKLLDKTQKILLATVDESLELMLPANSIRYPALRHFLEVKCRTVANNLIESARTQVHTHLEIEKHPYTQDNILFDNIADSRHRALK